jgi:hypothetical protein
VYGDRAVEIYLDDCRADTATGADASLSDLLDEMKQRAFSAGRLIVAITCDGIDVAGPHLAETLQRSVTAFERIEMQTADPASLVTEALETARLLLNESDRAAQQVVDLLTQGKTSTALPQLAECCRAWSQVHEAICNAVTMLRIDPDKLIVGDRTMPEVLIGPLEKLKTLKESLEAGDHVLVGDLLTYEFPEAMTAWRMLIDAVAGEAGNKTMNAER